VKVGLLQERKKHGGQGGSATGANETRWSKGSMGKDSEMMEAAVAHFNITFMHPPKSEIDVQRFGRTVNAT
jgi:hypothetical protein